MKFPMTGTWELEVCVMGFFIIVLYRTSLDGNLSSRKGMFHTKIIIKHDSILLRGYRHALLEVSILLPFIAQLLPF